MGNGPRLLMVSVALNVVLGAIYIAARPSVPKLEPASYAGSLQPNQPVALPVPAITNTATNVLPARMLDWRTIESDDYKRYVANLRLAGCPEKTVRDVIVADINELYRHRFRELFPVTNRLQYWKTTTPLADANLAASSGKRRYR